MIMGRRRIRHCVKCGADNEKPTGLKCRRVKDQLDPEDFVRNGAGSDTELGAAGGHPHNFEDDRPDNKMGPRTDHEDNDRLSAIESLVQRMANVVLHAPGEHRSRKEMSASRSESNSSTSSSPSPVGRKEKIPRKQGKLFDQNRHVNAGEIYNRLTC